MLIPLYANFSPLIMSTWGVYEDSEKVRAKMASWEGAQSDVVLVTGANSLLGQHVVKHLALYWEKLAEIRTFDENAFVKELGKFWRQE